MIKLKIIGSSSHGNCYVFETEKEALILEVGKPLMDVKIALNFCTKKIVGCIITHCHNDHAGYLREFVKAGIPCWALEDVFSTHLLNNKSLCHVIIPMRGYHVGNFKVIPFKVEHDVPCVGYIIWHEEMGYTMFVTDTIFIEQNIPGLNHIMIEANYSDEILSDNIEKGKLPYSLRGRLLNSHMEIETTCKILKRMDLSAVNEIILIHLSDGNSNAGQFKQIVEETTGKPTYIADAGVHIDLSINPY